MKLGKKPARPGAIKLQLASYLAPAVQLQPPPPEFGYEARLPTDWGMLGNDAVGDCVWAGAAHETMLWNKLASRDVGFSVADVLADYSADTGYDPADPATDQGSDMQAAASYRLKTGIVDSAGTRHRIGAYAAIAAGNLDQIKFAAWTFAAVGIGLTVGRNQIDQFNADQPWSGDPGADAGGHYVPVVGFRKGLLLCVSWGKVQAITVDYFARNNDENVVYFSQEMISRGAGPTGVYVWRLGQDVKALAKK